MPPPPAAASGHGRGPMAFPLCVSYFGKLGELHFLDLQRPRAQVVIVFCLCCCFLFTFPRVLRYSVRFWKSVCNCNFKAATCGHMRKVFPAPQNLRHFGSATSCEWDQLVECQQNWNQGELPQNWQKGWHFKGQNEAASERLRATCLQTGTEGLSCIAAQEKWTEEGRPCQQVWSADGGPSALEEY